MEVSFNLFDVISESSNNYRKMFLKYAEARQMENFVLFQSFSDIC